MRSVANIDLRLLRVFVAVVECGGYAAAQCRLNVGTSTISLHMSELELRLGFQLCERGRGGFRMTEKGRDVYARTKAMFQNLDDFSSAMSTLKNQLSGRIAIGMVDNLVTHPSFPLMSALQAFNETPNSVVFDLFTNSREVLEQAVLQGSLHAAIGPFVRRINGLAVRRLFAEEQRVYCGRGHVFYDKTIDRISPDLIRGLPIVVRSYHETFDEAHFGGGRPAAMVRNLEAMVVLLLSGHYLGFLPVHVAEPYVTSGSLHPLGGEESSYISEHMLITRCGAKPPAAVEEFLKYIVAELASRLQGAARDAARPSRRAELV